MGVKLYDLGDNTEAQFPICRFSTTILIRGHHHLEWSFRCGCLSHAAGYDSDRNGIVPAELGAVLQEEAFRVEETTLDGFVAVQIPEVRDGLTGRG